MLSLAVSGAGALIFSGYILYDTQNITYSFSCNYDSNIFHNTTSRNDEYFKHLFNLKYANFKNKTFIFR